MVLWHEPGHGISVSFNRSFLGGHGRQLGPPVSEPPRPRMERQILSMIKQGSKFPPISLQTTDGAVIHSGDFHQKEHGLYIFACQSTPEFLALASRFQGEAKLFQWLRTRLMVIFDDAAKVPTPWPAPGYQPLLFKNHLPDGLQWQQGYMVSRFGSVFEVYSEEDLDTLSAHKIERDVTYYEANHC
jgi:hypothetical protein